MKKVNCYIHIPFCTSKCKYCRFASFSGLNSLKVENYVNFLCREINSFQGEKIILDTIYFGGGTPSTLSENQFKKIFETLKQKFIFSENIEINIESTPEKITMENLISWEKLGINRLSIGVQTLNPKTLKEISRTEKGSVLEALENLKKFFEISSLAPLLKERGEIIEKNFKHKKRFLPSQEGQKTDKVEGFRRMSISLDFIIGLPFVEKGELKNDIKFILEKYDFVKHISVYMLEEYYEVPEEIDSKFDNIIYPNSWRANSISEEDFLEEYLEIKKFLEEKGFKRYEISNFAKSGFECKHNIGYWNHKENLAFGLGAHGFFENKRFSNSEDFLEYYSLKNIFIENIGEKEKFFEKIMFSLRTSGLEKKFLKKLNSEKIRYFLDLGYLQEKNENIVLADKATLFLDYILSEIL